jgi:hypothetical protein
MEGNLRSWRKDREHADGAEVQELQGFETITVNPGRLSRRRKGGVPEI